MSNPAIQMLEQGIEFVKRSGLKVEALERGRVVCRMPLAGNVNHIGTMYAGALFTLAEIPGGALFLSSFDAGKFYPIVTDLQISFKKAVKSDATVEICMEDAEIERIQAEATTNGKALFELRGELRNADGELVATSVGQYQMRQIGR
jgi:thioesterase domain-containing protein